MKYFAYGSNMDLEQIASRCPRNYKLLGVAELEGYEFFINNLGVASIALDTVNPETVVYGPLFEISKNCLSCLDMHEGHPSAYKRDLIKVKFKGEEAEAWVYTDTRTSQSGTPRPNYLERIIEAATSFGFPKDYIEHLKSFLRKKDQ